MLHKASKRLSTRRTTTMLPSERKHIPYLALTQTCMQIRAEFRPMWLSTHRLPLNLTDTYFKAFFPTRTPRTLARFKPQTKTVIDLRIWVRKEEIDHCDVTRLFRHKARFPRCTITCQGLPDMKEKTLRELERVMNHSNPVWTEWMSGNRISQVRLRLARDKTVSLTAVVKEKFAEPWMKVISAKPPKGALEESLKRFGLEDDFWKAEFCVDYS
jgi:hypothetical protein